MKRAIQRVLVVALSVVAALLVTLRPAAAAAAEPAGDAACPPAALDAVPPVLDPACRHQKALQLELAPYGGSLLGPTIDSTFLVGGRLWLHLTAWLAAGASYGWTRPSAGLPDADVHLVAGEVAFSNDMAIRFGQTVVPADLYLTLGLGAVRLRDWELLGVLGGGVKFYTGLSWLAIRIDVNSYLHPTPGGDGVDVDLAVTPGVSFLFP